VKEIDMRRLAFCALTLLLSATYAIAEELRTGTTPAGEACRLTPPQAEGPCYPPKAQMAAQIDKDNDLTQIKGEPGSPKGQVLYVLGRVRDAHCRPIAGAIVEFWQAS